MPSLDRQILEQTLRGYAEVNRITEAERRIRLRHITDEQAHKLFDNISSMIVGRHENNAGYHKYRLAHHLSVRQAMAKISRMMGYESSL